MGEGTYLNHWFLHFQNVEFCVRVVRCIPKRVDEMQRSLPRTGGLCSHRRTQGWRRRCRRHTGVCDCTTVSHAQNFHSRAAGKTEKNNFTLANIIRCWELQGKDVVYNFNSIMKTATEFGSLWIWTAVDFCFLFMPFCLVWELGIDRAPQRSYRVVHVTFPFPHSNLIFIHRLLCTLHGKKQSLCRKTRSNLTKFP